MNWTPDTELRDRLAAWETACLGDLAGAYHQGRLDQYVVGLRALMAREEGRERAALLAVLALGPRGRGLPGAGDIVPLMQLVAETPADVLDIVVAWGAGWGRLVWPEHEWHARWVSAVLVLTSLVRVSIDRTVTWLARNVRDFRIAQSERLEGLAEGIALRLATGASSRPGHRLDTWRPERCELSAFVAMAVSGGTLFPPRAEAFTVSMLAAVLDAGEHRLVDRCRDRVAVARTDK